MYPYQRTPRIPREHNKYHGYTLRGTPNCPLIFVVLYFQNVVDMRAWYKVMWEETLHDHTEHQQCLVLLMEWIRKKHETCCFKIVDCCDFGQVHPRGLEAVGLGAGVAKTSQGNRKFFCDVCASWLKAEIQRCTIISFNDITYIYIHVLQIFRVYRINMD